MSKHVELPPRVYPKGRWYYLVTAEGRKRLWTKLTKIHDGIPALYQKLADIHARDVAPDRIPALVSDWLAEVSTSHAKKTQANDRWVMGVISESLAEFRASQIKPPDVATFLKPFRLKPRTHNEMRAGVRELMRFAEEKGFREAGTNPADSIRTISAPPRDKYITDSELRRIKVAAMRDYRGKITRAGPMICAAIDMAYLTGQRVSDILDLRWSKKLTMNKAGEVVAPYIDTAGIYFKPSKTAGSTGAKVLIAWTPRLSAVVERIRAMKRRNTHWVITQEDAQPYTYSGFFRRWKRAVKLAGVNDCHFNDLRAKALTDKEAAQGMQAARRMGAHSTEAQTADYVRHRQAQITPATR
ncbi:tyrosine-type recombinase/integrase [Ramlibacter sp. Leaf400]|uniref:tyrosine-type recombinase/integrase n=1 Tax=Ramlibacter sp. Leaf400 TaxID=1736365 RepID=UPI0006FC5445|nr:tyrosine-type recombinase/integrase [Ramlibacter sp. Leaf400]KQT10995.1 integrase [Ramlibacter sp. Leaf400]